MMCIGPITHQTSEQNTQFLLQLTCAVDVLILDRASAVHVDMFSVPLELYVHQFCAFRVLYNLLLSLSFFSR